MKNKGSKTIKSAQAEVTHDESRVSEGAVLAREIRVAANNLTDAEREALDEDAMRLFYGKTKRPKVSTHRS